MDIRCIIQIENFEMGESISGENYINLLDNFNYAVKEKIPN